MESLVYKLFITTLWHGMRKGPKQERKIVMYIFLDVPGLSDSFAPTGIAGRLNCVQWWYHTAKVTGVETECVGRNFLE